MRLSTFISDDNNNNNRNKAGTTVNSRQQRGEGIKDVEGSWYNIYCTYVSYLIMPYLVPGIATTVLILL